MKALKYFAIQLASNTGGILYINLLGMILISILEGFGILLLVPMLSMSNLIDLNIDKMPFSETFSSIRYLPGAWGLALILVLYVFIILGQGVLKRTVAISNTKIQQRFMQHLRLSTFGALLEANWEFHMRRRKSDFVNSLTAEIARVSGGISTLLLMVTSLVFTVVQVGLAIWLSPQLTALVLVCALILGLISKKFIHKSKNLGKQNMELAKDYLAEITDQLNGIKDIKSNSLEKSRLEWLAALDRKIQQEQLEQIKVKTASQFLYQAAAGLFIAFFIFLAVKLFHSQIEQLLLIIVIFSRLWPRFSGIQSNLESMASMIPAFQSVMELQEKCKEAREYYITDKTEKNSKIDVDRLIECHNVSFRYNKHESLFALKDVSIQIPSKQITAIIGRSGAGKSSLIDIVMGLILPEEGEVLINGIPLTKENLLSFRQEISYVPQDPFLFNASIKENLLMVKPDASDDEIWEAIDFSKCMSFIKRLPRGLDTVIGDRGICLSGGERQRLILARAILRKPSILVLDEATSALDMENESKIHSALERLKGKMTIIIIAHRLSTLRNADQVIVLDQGRVVQAGGFSQLSKDKKGLFSHLLGKQAQVM